MKITIKKGIIPNNIIRQIKLENINGTNINKDPIIYNYGTQPENSDEDIRDLHLFCISITMSLVGGSILINETDRIEYKKSQDSININTELIKISNYISNDKRCNPDKYKKSNN